MRRLVPFLALMLFVVSVPLQAQPAIDRSKFIVFIHAGPKLTDPVVRRIAGALYTKGFVVRSPDNDQDETGGPGVDYFADTAKDAAQDVAEAVNMLMAKPEGAPTKKLAPRRQNTKTPANYLGVWLF